MPPIVQLNEAVLLCEAPQKNPSPSLTEIDWSFKLVNMQEISASDFKARCLALIDEVAATGSPVVISKRGRVVAELISYTGSAEQYPQDTLRGTVSFSDDIEQPVVPADNWDAAAE